MPRLKRRALLPLIAMGGVLFLLAPTLAKHGARLRSRSAFGGLCRCLLQDHRLAPSQADERLRALEIAQDLPGAKPGWPYRCEGELDKLEKSIAKNKKPDANLRAVGLQLKHTRRYLRKGHDSLFDVAELLRLGHALGWQTKGPLTRFRSPKIPVVAPARLVRAEKMVPLYQGDYLRILSDPAGTSNLDLLFYEQSKRYALCRVDLLALAPTRCQGLSSALPTSLAGRLYGRKKGAPRRMFARGVHEGSWLQGLFDPLSGKVLQQLRSIPLGGFIFDAKDMVLLDFETPLRDFVLRFSSPDKQEQSVILDLPTTSFGPRIIHDELVWGVPLTGGRHRIMARRLRPRGRHDELDPGRLGLARQLVITPPLPAAPKIDVCRTDKLLALMVAGRIDRKRTVASLVLRSGRQWQAPYDMTVGTRFGFTCQGDGASLSWAQAKAERDAPELRTAPSDAKQAPPVSGSYSVHRLDCRRGQCQLDHKYVQLQRYSRNSRYVAGALGRSMLLMWRSPLGDIRMRIAPLDKLPQEPDTPLFDDSDHGGFGWDLERDPIFGRAGHVLLLLSRQVGQSNKTATYGVRIDAAGKAYPLNVVQR